MHITVVEHHNGGERREFEGPDDEVAGNLRHAYPFLLLRHGPHAKAEDLVRELDRTQAYTATILDQDLIFKSIDSVSAGVDQGVVGDMLGGFHRHAATFEAAEFLSGRPEVMSIREAMLQADEDPERAALIAYGLEPDASNLEALRAVLKASGRLEKAEEPALPKQAVAATPNGEVFASMTQRALDRGDAFHVKLGGRHSAGSILAVDQVSQVRLLLKPGSGPVSPIAGDREEAASQAKREVAFSAVARLWGLGDVVPESHLLLLDGHEYAAIQLLPWTFKSMAAVSKEDPGLPRRLFHLYLGDGALHRWAVMDWVLGNADRHAGNIMRRDDQVYLIDHGSSMAGPDFSPATDRLSFVPYYLRAMAPSDFSQLSPESKLHALPRLHANQASELGGWVQALDEQALSETLARSGVDPGPSVARLRQLKVAVRSTPADLAVNAQWVIP